MQQSTISSRTEIISNEISRLSVLFITSRTVSTAELQERVNIYIDALAEIPVESLSRVFSQARKESRIFPKPEDLIGIWRESKRRDATKEAPTGMSPDILSWTFYTLANLPWCYIPNKYRRLIRLEREGQITDHEDYELQNARKNMKWWHNDLRLNEDVEKESKAITL